MIGLIQDRTRMYLQLDSTVKLFSMVTNTFERSVSATLLVIRQTSWFDEGLYFVSLNFRASLEEVSFLFTYEYVYFT